MEIPDQRIFLTPVRPSQPVVGQRSSVILGKESQAFEGLSSFRSWLGAWSSLSPLGATIAVLSSYGATVGGVQG